MDHFDTLSNSLASVRNSFDAIAAAVEHESRGGQIKRQLAGCILNELLLIAHVVDLHSHVLGVGCRAKTVSDFQGEYHELAEL